MDNRFLRSAAAGLGLSLVAGSALAQQQPASHPCASVQDDAARLACYDAAFGHPAGPGKPQAAAPAAAGALEPTVNAREEFGLSEIERRARNPSQGAQDSITGKVTNVAHRATGELIVTLEDGQVWVEVLAYTGVLLRAGDTVTIRRAALGSYLLVTPKNVATRVRRVK
jgi:hypothetical protein